MKKLPKNNVQKIGLFGGSFDPVHIGHVIICDFIREEMNLDKVIFVPAFRSPHKKESEFTTPQQRYKMVELAIKDNTGFEISDYEICKDHAIYSIETIEYIKHLYPSSQLFMIVGADSYKSFSKWKDPEKIRDNAKLVVASRDSITIDVKDHFSKSPNIEISSTMIRDRIHKNLSIKYLVNSDVEHYIYEKQLYK